MTESDFLTLAAQGYNRIALTLETLADLDTPLSLYLKLANGPHSFLLESVVGGERFGRYSFIGLPCRTRIAVRGKRITVTTPGDEVKHEVADPLAFIAGFQGQFKVATIPGMPRFCGGLAGYFGYETIRYIEPKLAAKPEKSDPINVPDIVMMLTDELAVMDNLTGKITLIVYADPARPDSYEKAAMRLTELRGRLRQPAIIPLQPATHVQQAFSVTGEKKFKADVGKCKEYIAAGDCMQVLPSQRMEMPFAEPPISLYRALRTLNPSPYMFYYDFGDFHVVGASPEILVRQEAGTVTVRPLAGTRPRGKTREEDAANEAELLADPKEIAEHVMLIDLGRNDVGRVAEIGSVKLTDKMTVERYSHVMHIVSHVDGKLKAGLNNIDVLRATFPAGTLSGAPKIRAMEIIDELETLKRGIYGGAVGYLSYQGDMDLAIAIRTAIIKSGKLYAQAAAGVVHDSIPENEWQETLAKTRAVIRAAEMVQRGLDDERNH